MLVAGTSEYNFGDSEFLMLFLVMITIPFAAARTERDRAMTLARRHSRRCPPPGRARSSRASPARPCSSIGDVMLDRFLFGRVSRISPEAPVPVVVHDHDEYRLGGAANVAHNVARWAAASCSRAFVGDDEDGRSLELGDGGARPDRRRRW